jgi:hypothetical protein
MLRRSRRKRLASSQDVRVVRELAWSSWSYAGLEKRGEHRSGIRLPVMVRSENHRSGLAAVVVDVSRGGMAVQVAGPAAEVPWPDRQVTVLIRTTTGQVSIVTRVVRDGREGDFRTLGLELDASTEPSVLRRYKTFVDRILGVSAPVGSGPYERRSVTPG